MICPDYHVHTTFCDGKNTPEETVKAALAAGMPAIGFSGHSHTAFDESYCMSLAGTKAYKEEIRRLQQLYGDKIRILCGVEQDYYGDLPADEYDFVIGSVHYLKFGDEYVPVDASAATLRAAAERFCGGDMLKVCELYYETVGKLQTKTGCDFIGHFDLITKFSEREPLFDENDPRYVTAWQTAADKLLDAGAVFELNTGAITRGYRTTPYPAPEILAYLGSRNATVIFSSDSHRKDTLCFGFEELAARAERYRLRVIETPRAQESGFAAAPAAPLSHAIAGPEGTIGGR